MLAFLLTKEVVFKYLADINVVFIIGHLTLVKKTQKIPGFANNKRIYRN